MSTPFWPGLVGSWVTWTAPLLLSCFNWFCSPIRITFASTNRALRSTGLRGSAGAAWTGLAGWAVAGALTTGAGPALGAGSGVADVAGALEAGRAGGAAVAAGVARVA